MKLSPPPLKDALYVEELLAPTWAEWFTTAGVLAGSLAESGVTADRPTKGLFQGRPYFDTTLGYTIWLKSVRPTVWVRWDGVSV